MSTKKRYTVSQTADSFLIKNSRHSLDVPGAPDWLVEFAYDYSGIRRTPVTAVRHPYYCEVCWKSHRERLCFPNFYRLVECVASGLMADWEPPDRSNGKEDDQPVLYPLEQAEKFLRPWAVKRTAWAINTLVHSEWNRLLGGVNEEVLKVQQKVLAASFGYEDSSLVMCRELWGRKILSRWARRLKRHLSIQQKTGAIGPAG